MTPTTTNLNKSRVRHRVVGDREGKWHQDGRVHRQQPGQDNEGGGLGIRWQKGPQRREMLGGEIEEEMAPRRDGVMGQGW